MLGHSLSKDFIPLQLKDRRNYQVNFRRNFPSHFLEEKKNFAPPVFFSSTWELCNSRYKKRKKKIGKILSEKVPANIVQKVTYVIYNQPISRF